MSDARTRLPRFKVKNLRVIYDTGEGYWSGPVVDSSATGLFIETAHELPVGTRITLMPEGSADDDRMPFEVQGIVVRQNDLDFDNHWSRTPGLAIKFEELTAEQTEQLHAYLVEYGSSADND